METCFNFVAYVNKKQFGVRLSESPQGYENRATNAKVKQFLLQDYLVPMILKAVQTPCSKLFGYFFKWQIRHHRFSEVKT